MHVKCYMFTYMYVNWSLVHFMSLPLQLPLLGGVPLMVHSKDMSNTMPDEKVVTMATHQYHYIMWFMGSHYY